MSDRGDGHSLAAGGPARHIPVLREAALAALSPRPGGVYLDGTFGAGGYSRAILSIPGTRVVALDRDPEAIEAGAELATANDRLSLHQARFSALEEVAEALGIAAFDGVVFDIGVSSMQIDQASRGFSFRQDGPLDMRMGGEGPTAADIVNTAEEEDLANILFYFGEERASRRIARAIVHDRRAAPFTSTRQLAEMIARVVPAAPGDIHPATRSFQALRIAANNELGELAAALVAAECKLVAGGRLVVVTFHSLEDRIVKRFLQARSGRGAATSRHLPSEAAAPPTFTIEGRQPIVPEADEVAQNPRARSAKLRFGTRTAAAARGPEPALRSLYELPARKGR